MKNYVQPGNTITLTAPYAVTSGDGLLVGSIFGIASGAAALGTCSVFCNFIQKCFCSSSNERLCLPLIN